MDELDEDDGFEYFRQDDLKTIGSRIRDLRLKANLTQDELAKKMGYKSRSTINKIEKGLVDISQTKMYQFSKILNITPPELMGWPEFYSNIPDANLDFEVSISKVDFNDELRHIKIKLGKQVIENVVDELTISSLAVAITESLNEINNGEK